MSNCSLLYLLYNDMMSLKSTLGKKVVAMNIIILKIRN